MTLLVGVLSMGRRMAESRMTDSCRVFRGPAEVLDPVTDEWGPNTASEVYSGPCRVKHPTTAAKDVDSGSQLLAVSALEIHLPLSAYAVAAKDVVEITASDTRPDSVGRRFTVAAPFDGSQTTALRFRVEVGDGR